MNTTRLSQYRDYLQDMLNRNRPDEELAVAEYMSDCEQNNGGQAFWLDFDEDADVVADYDMWTHSLKMADEIENFDGGDNDYE